MEKISLNQKKDATIFITVTTVFAIASYLYGVKISIIFVLIFNIALMFTFKVIFDFLYHSRFSFDENGIILNWHFDNKIVPWNELKADVIKLNKDQIRIIFFKNSDKILSIKVDYLNNQSLSNLVSKYCPPDHELYKLVQEYAKNKGIPF